MGCAIKNTFIPVLQPQNQFYRAVLGGLICASLFLVVGCGGDANTKSPPPSKSTDNSTGANAEPEGNPSQETITQDNPEVDPFGQNSPKLNDDTKKDPLKDPTKITGDRPKDPPVENPSTDNSNKKRLNAALILKGIDRKRPENVADWGPTDLRPAIETKDPLLPLAIRHFEKQHEGDPQIVSILMQFLDPNFLNPPGAGPDNGTNPNNGSPKTGNTQPLQLDDKTVERIIVMLARNRTPEAARALRKIVTDKNLSIFQPQTATKAALKVLAVMDIDRKENDNVLFTAMVKPRKYRDLQGSASSGNRNQGWGGGQRLSAEQLSQEAEQILKPLASEQIRTRLAAHVLPDSAIRGSDREKFLAWFKESAPENVMGQLRIYEENVPNPELLDQFEKYFTRYSGAAIGRLLGVLPSTPDLSRFGDNKDKRPSLQELRGWGGSGSANKDDELAIYIAEQFDAKAHNISSEEELVHLTKKLWSNEIAAILISRLNERLAQDPLKDYGKEKDTQKIDEKNRIAMACTIPLDKVRHTLFKRCKNHYQQGPAVALADIFPKNTESKSMDPGVKTSDGNAGGGGTSNDAKPIAIDPGLLVTLKMLHREDPNIVPSGPGGMEMRTGGTENVQNQWFYASQQLVAEILGQCYKACSASPAMGGMQPTAVKPKAEGEKAEADPSSVELHKNAKIVSRLDFKLPQSVQGSLGDLPMDPLEVHYIRIEENNRHDIVANHYRRTLKGQEHLLDGGNMGYWFDSIKDGNAKGTKRSVDVLITPGTQVANPVDNRGRPPRGPLRGMPIVVQILVVEAANPKIEK